MNGLLSFDKLTDVKLEDYKGNRIPVTIYRGAIDEAMAHIVLELKALVQKMDTRPKREQLHWLLEKNLFLPELTENGLFLIYTGKGIIHQIRLSPFLAMISIPNSSRKKTLKHLERYSLPFNSVSLETLSINKITLIYQEATIELDTPKEFSVTNKDLGSLSYSLRDGETFSGLISSLERYCEAGTINSDYGLYLHDILNMDYADMDASNRRFLLMRDMGI